MAKNFLRTGLPGILGALVALGCATTGVNKGDINLISVQQEVQMGQEFSREIARTYPILEDPEITAYFQRIGERIARSSDWPNLQYHFQVVNTADVNAFAIPGGWVYVHRGLIERADNVSEVACVMAHEIGHVVARHGTEMLTKQYGIAIVTQLVLGQNPKLWQKITAELFTTAGILAYSRKQEYEADELGVQYAYRSGYDPNGMVTFFEKLLQLQEREPSLLEVWFSTHPPTSERIQRAKGLITKLPPKTDFVRDDPEFLRLRERLRALPPAERLKERQAQ
ncbi:MAG: M48 family metallopeptidase [candidate division KSB1 bacterium]|nr:M48 family metallopeptidase [candidate division KSB1 bacterium]